MVQGKKDKGNLPREEESLHANELHGQINSRRRMDGCD